MDRISEQRIFPRFHYSIPIKYCPKNNTASIYTVTRDISVGGLKILTHSFLPRGTNVSVEVKVPSSSGVVNALASVVWSNRISHSEQYLSGLRFSEIEDRDKKNISDLVNYAFKH
ncbi:MAG: PilZ domain-containing protein [Candidatus Omnitrophota bacterium]